MYVIARSVVFVSNFYADLRGRREWLHLDDSASFRGVVEC